MREVELSLNGTLREIFSFGESRGAFDRCCFAKKLKRL